MIHGLKQFGRLLKISAILARYRLDEMLQLARRNAADAGATNVEFLRGTIEAVPLPDSSVDVVISNCVVNLAADKAAVLAEIARVLRPGGVLVT